MDSNPLHGCPGGLYRPTPQGYNGNLAGWEDPAVSVCGRRLLHRLLGLADWSGAEPTGRLHRLRVWSAAGYCSLAPDDVGFAEVSMATMPPSGGLSL